MPKRRRHHHHQVPTRDLDMDDQDETIDNAEEWDAEVPGQTGDEPHTGEVDDAHCDDEFKHGGSADAHAYFCSHPDDMDVHALPTSYQQSGRHWDYG